MTRLDKIVFNVLAVKKSSSSRKSYFVGMCLVVMFAPAAFAFIANLMTAAGKDGDPLLLSLLSIL